MLQKIDSRGALLLALEPRESHLRFRNRLCGEFSHCPCFSGVQTKPALRNAGEY
jgi:hypothetical protein